MVFAPALADTGRVIDDAHLLSPMEERALQQQIDAIRDTHGMDVAIVTKDGIGYQSIHIYAADYYEAAGFGVGAGEDGLIFLIDMEERKYFTATHGRAVSVFTDYGLDEMHENITPYLSDGEYAAAFSFYLDQVDRLLRYEADRGYAWNVQKGNTYWDLYTGQEISPLERMLEVAPMIFLGALVIGAVVVALVFKNQLRTVRYKTNATNYMQEDSFRLTRVQDIYLYTHTTRRKIETNHSSGGGGGSSTFRSSSGGSFGGRGGKF